MQYIASQLFLFLTKGDICYDIPLLVLKSDTKGVCFSSDIIVSNYTTTLTNISVTLTANDNSERYPTQCSSVEAPVLLGHYEFVCTGFDEPKEIQFIITGYNITIGRWWSATVRAFIPHKCSTGDYLYNDNYNKIHIQCSYI